MGNAQLGQADDETQYFDVVTRFRVAIGNPGCGDSAQEGRQLLPGNPKPGSGQSTPNNRRSRHKEQQVNAIGGWLARQAGFNKDG